MNKNLIDISNLQKFLSKLNEKFALKKAMKGISEDAEGNIIIGEEGLVPTPDENSKGKFLRSDGTWSVPGDSPLYESMTQEEGIAGVSKVDRVINAKTLKAVIEENENVVHTSGNETIDGTKTFSSKIVGNLQGNADSSTYLTAQENSAMPTETSALPKVGMYHQKLYSDTGYPIKYGNLINIQSKDVGGSGQLLLGWSGTSGSTENIYYRNKRDTADAKWSDWRQIAYVEDLENKYLPLTGGTLNGKLTLNHTSLAMSVKDLTSDTIRTHDVLHAKSSDTRHGLNLGLGGFGNTVVGSGESIIEQLNELEGNNEENLYLTSDVNMFFKVGVNNNYANAKTISLNKNAELSGLSKVTSTSFVGTLTGNADTSTKATQDSAGQQIDKTYIKELSVSGRTITYKRGDNTTGTITTQDTNTTYSVATTSTNGLMSSSDKSKLDGIASGANKYSLPTAGTNALGGVKTSSTVTSTSGLTACPIISGIPYYKDTNTTYSKLSQFTNDTGFITSKGSCNYATTAGSASSVPWSGVTDKPLIPTKTSELTNDSDFAIDNDVVHTSGNETIDGTKTFTGGVTLSSTAKMTVNHAKVVKGTNPSSTQFWQIFNCDKNGADWGKNTLSIIEGALDAKGKSSIYFRACKNEANSTANSTLSVVYDSANNKTWAECPTPDANSNDKKIATTAWVTAKGYLTSHQSLSNYSTLANTVKSISISGKTITVTPGSGDAYTLTTQDTTYSNFVKSGSGAKAGLVPSPGTTAGTTKYLREDGTWQVPPDHTYTVNNATLTIQKNGSNVATFTANSSSNKTANITVPTKVSELTNDSNFVNTTQLAAKADDSKVVHLSGDETISGQKTINQPLIFNNTTTSYTYLGSLRTVDFAKGDDISGYSNQYNGFSIVTANSDAKNTNRFIVVDGSVLSNGDTQVGMHAFSTKAGSNHASITVNYNRASDTFTTYAPTPPAGDNSTQIATTAWVTAKDNNVVHKTGNETVKGVKTFTRDDSNAAIVLAHGSFKKGDASDVRVACLYTGDGTSYANSLNVYDVGTSDSGNITATSIMSIENTAGESGASKRTSLQIVYHKNPRDGRKQYATLSGDFLPSANDTYTLGNSSFKWKSIYGNLVGNADTATQFSANKAVTLKGDVTGTASSKGGWSVATTLANSGVTAGTYGPSSNVTGNNNATISVPQITVDAKGRVTSVVNRTLTCKNNTYTIPTKVSQLTNDSKFVNSTQLATKADDDNVVHRSGNETIDGTKTFSSKIVGNLQGNADTSTRSTYATTQATTDNSTKIATTAWVRNYVNSVAGSNTVGSSVSAYWSNNSNVTATGTASAFSNTSSMYPECYSEYITKTPTVGTIYSGAQLYTVLNTYASAKGTIQSSGQYNTRITTVTAQATFSNPISPTGKYLCTTANTVKFRAYVTAGNDSTVGSASVVNNSSTKSIFIRVE